MASLPLLVLATLLATTTATTSWLPPEGLAVEQPGCSDNVMVNQGLIIDIKASVNFGAELLDGEVQDSFSTCITTCCGMERCDMALYKQGGFSKSGKNCYYIHCGVPANCRMLEHEGFVSATLVGGGYDQIGQGRENNNGDVMAPYTSTPPLPPPTPPTQPVAEEETDLTAPTIGSDLDEVPEGTATPATEDSSPANGEEGPIFEVVPVQPVEDPGLQTPNSDTTTTTDSYTTAITDSHTTTTTDSDTITTTDSDTTSPNSIPTPDSNAEELGTSESELAESELETSELELSESESNQTGIKNGNETAEERANISVNTDSKHGCDQDGCDGRVLIFVALVGSIWILILVVLAFVVMKKLRDRRRKERFHNVDYLINGMYA